MKRRVRMYQCQYCGTVSPAGRKEKDYPYAITVCPHCFCVGQNTASNTWLADNPAAGPATEKEE